MFRLILFLSVWSLVAFGCAPAKLEEATWQDKNLNIIWPQPPEQPRIKLLQVILGAQNVVDGSSGAIKKILDYITGNEEEFIDFYTPQCIAADGNGLIYIADPSAGIVHKFNLATKEVQYIFMAGEKKLGGPIGVALDKDNNLYVTDAQLVSVFKFGSNGNFLGELDGKGKLRRPAGIAIRSNGDKIVADALADRVFIFGKDDVLKGELAGSDFKESFNRPTYVAVDNEDNAYITDTMNFTVRVFDANNRYLRSQGQIGDVPGSFARPKGVAMDSEQNIYVVDSIFGNIQIFDQKGQLLLYFGQEGTLPGEFMLPSGIFIDKNDKIYISDTFNHRIQIYKYLKDKVQ